MRVLFVCRQNAGRSQMSEALFAAAAGGRHEARSAGTEPAAAVHPVAVEAMREVGMDLSGRTPHPLETADAEWADVVVTMGCGDACPYVPGKRYLDWELDDPAGRPLEEVRAIRDEIAARLAVLTDELDAFTTSPPGVHQLSAPTAPERREIADETQPDSQADSEGEKT